jgi:cell division protein ZapD
VIRYEHPLNERIRTLMRLEDLFARAHYFAERDGAPEHHAALLSLFEVTDVAARADLKTDLVQELERQKQVLGPLRSNPQIDQHALTALLAEIEQVNASLLAQAGKVGMHLRENEWLMAIKQRAAIPGGVCEFDLPAYHHWLNKAPEARRQDLARWLEPFAPIRSGSAIVLRDSSARCAAAASRSGHVWRISGLIFPASTRSKSSFAMARTATGVLA